MIYVLASIRITEGRRDAFIEIFKANIPNVLKEEACLEYVPTIDVATGLPPQETGAHGVTIIEKWRSLDDLKGHLVAPHMRAYREQAKDLVSGASFKVLTEA